MGLLKQLRGLERSPEVEDAVSLLELRLPEGWHFEEFRHQLFCRRPVKLSVYGATAEGPLGERALAITTDERDGVDAVQALADHLESGASVTRRWAPPLYLPPFEEWQTHNQLREPDSDEEAAARGEAIRLLPEGSVPMNVDCERFGDVRVFAVVTQLPDHRGMAGAGVTAPEAWLALVERQRGELAESAVWFPPLDG
jgi:hypothetical protein